MKFCPNCGAQIDANDKFCTNCGAALNDGSATTPAQPTQVQVQPVQQVQPTQPIQEVQPVLNASRTVTATKKKGFNLKFLIIAIVVVLAVAGFGFYKYRTSPAHNPNNPLANQNFTFVRDEDSGKINISESQQGRVVWNLLRIALEKKDPNSAATKYFASHPQGFMDQYLYKDTRKAESFEEVVSKDKKVINIIKDISDNYFTKTFFKISPNNSNVKNGDKVTIFLPQDKTIASEYGLDLTPRTVKVQGLKN